MKKILLTLFLVLNSISLFASTLTAPIKIQLKSADQKTEIKNLVL